MEIQYFRLGYGPLLDIAIETMATGYDHEVVVMFPSLSKSGVYNVDGNKMLSFKAKADHVGIENIVRYDITPDMMPTADLKQMYEDVLAEDPAMLWADGVFGSYYPDNSELPATTDIKRTYIGKCSECGKVGVIVELEDGGTWCPNCE